MINGVLANCTVSDLDRAEEWYTAVCGRPPDSRPMDGLLEWHFGDGRGLQVWREPARAGRSTAVLSETDLDRAAARLSAQGIRNGGPQPGGASRIVQLADPDGNRVVLVSD
jgi:catechol 2,3-dioxygenase-like lactoylglutathione lyase family enzyme